MASRSAIRQAVILAAGTGSRLRQNEQDLPKPLHVVAQMTLIERTLRTLAQAGVDRFVVVVGFMAEAIRQAVQEMPFVDASLSLTFVHNADFQKSNGVSLVRARAALDGPSLLSMSDHVYDAALPCLAAQADMSAADLYLCVDRRLDEIYDMDDATKVKTRDDAIVKIGKQLTDFDCIDTGVFAVAPRLVDMLAELEQQKGDFSFSEGVAALAARGRARVLDIGEAFWQDVDTPGALARAESILGGASGR